MVSVAAVMAAVVWPVAMARVVSALAVMMNHAVVVFISRVE